MGILNQLKAAFNGPSEDYKELVTQGAIIVDVRSKQEFQSGHAKGSKNVPLNRLADNLKSFKGKDVIVVCRSGARSGQAKSMLERNGIKAYNAGAWQNVATLN
jgi:rhodanese-related sulfurtransferase